MILSLLPGWGKTMSMRKGDIYVDLMYPTPARCQLSAGEHAPLPTTNNPCLLGKYLVPGKGPYIFSPLFPSMTQGHACHHWL